MNTILGFSTDPTSDRLVAERVIALASGKADTQVVMVAHARTAPAFARDRGPAVLPGEGDNEARDRAAHMASAAIVAGLDASAQATNGREHPAVDAVCKRFAPDSIVVGTPKHRIVGNLWAAESVRAAKHRCASVESLHA